MSGEADDRFRKRQWSGTLAEQFRRVRERLRKPNEPVEAERSFSVAVTRLLAAQLQIHCRVVLWIRKSATKDCCSRRDRRSCASVGTSKRRWLKLVRANHCLGPRLGTTFGY